MGYTLTWCPNPVIVENVSLGNPIDRLVDDECRDTIAERNHEPLLGPEGEAADVRVNPVRADEQIGIELALIAQD